MRTFKKWDQLEKMNCGVIINHALFEKQQYNCNMLQIVNDEHRIGVKIKNQEIFVYKQDVIDFEIHNNTYMISDGRLTITIIMNKL